MPQPPTRRVLLVAALVTVGVAVAIRLDVSEWLRGGYGWRWPYDPLAWLPTLLLAAVVTGYVLGAWWLLRRGNRPRTVIAWSMVGTVALTVAALALREGDVLYTLFARTASDLGTGPHWVATRIDWASGEWRSWGETITGFGGHLSNLPPGSVMWYALLSDALDRVPGLAALGQAGLWPYQCHNPALWDYSPGQWTSTAFGMAMPLWAALTPLVLYAVARRLTGVRDNARAVVLWFPLIPAVAGFAGSWNTLYPLIALLALLTLQIGSGQSRLRYGWVALSGLITGLGWFINLALVPLPLLFGVWVLVNEWIVRRRSFWQCIVIGLVFGGGLVTIWGVFWLVTGGLATGETIFDLLAAGLSFHLTLERPYWFWVVMHPWDWLLWGGLAFGVVMLVRIIGWLRGSPRDLTTLPVMSVSLTVAMVILVLSGTARGETGRVWLFFAPFLLLAAAELWPDHTPLTARGWAWLAVPQAVLWVAVLTSIPTLTTNFTPPPIPPQTVAVRPADARFVDDDGGGFRLVGWDATVDGDTLTLSLVWRGEHPVTPPVWFGGVLVGADGQTIGLEAWQPGEGATTYPTSCWRDGVRVGDTHTVTLGDLTPGDWWLSLSAYGDTTQPDGRLTVTTPDGDGLQVGLGPVRVP